MIIHPREGDPLIEEQLGVLLEHSRELLLLLDDHAHVRWASPTSLSWLGPSVLGAPMASLVHTEDSASLAEHLGEVETRSGAVGELTVRLRHLSGSWHRMDLTTSNRRAVPAVEAVVVLARESPEPRLTEARLVHQATHDALTALPNRADLLSRLSHAGKDEDRRGASLALLYIDLDGFKAVNDSQGHSAGDRVLVVIADRLRRAVRPGDAVARLGGDEFVVVADGVEDPAVALEIGDRIVASLRQPVGVGSRQVAVHASVGVALGEHERALALLEEADRAMYRAKRDGRNRCVLFDQELQGPDETRLLGEDLLRRALERDGVNVLYQPVFDLTTGSPTGVEAMIRLRDADGGIVTTSSFLDLAEETGLAVAVGAGLLDLACRQLAAWRAELGPKTFPTLAVAITARQLVEGRAATRVAATLAGHGLEPADLCLRLPESVVVDADSAVARSLQKLKALGVRLAVDDFGRGRSSLASLRHFGIDLLVIDAGLVAGLRQDDGTGKIIRAVVGIGETLGMLVAAKGVEDADQAERLRHLGCHQGQGSYFQVPAPPGQIHLETPSGRAEQAGLPRLPS